MRLRLLAAPLLLGSCGSSGAPPPEAPPSDRAARVDAALGWLPEECETVMVANGPFHLVDPRRSIDRNAVDGFYQQERLHFVELVRAGVFSLANGALWGETKPIEAFAAVEFDFALEGSHRFRPPRGLGMGSYRGCFVAAAMPSSHAALDLLFAGVLQRASQKIELAGIDVARFDPPAPSGPLAPEPMTLFVAAPRAGLLCIANDRAEIEALLVRMREAPGRLAFPPELPEWRHVDRAAAFYALRHFRKDGAEEDPTSPLRGAASANVPDPGAIGLVIVVRDGLEVPSIARYLSDSEDALRVAREGFIPSEGPPPRVEEIAPGVVEVTQECWKPLPASRFLFHALTLLGHAIYV